MFRFVRCTVFQHVYFGFRVLLCLLLALFCGMRRRLLLVVGVVFRVVVFVGVSVCAVVIQFGLLI